MKKGAKLLSVLLAFVMAISVFAATFAASAAKATYTELVTEEDVDFMLEDVNTVLAKNVLNGDAIEAIYKFLPSLSAIVNNGGSVNSATAEFYKTAQPERFADLPDGEIVADVTDENGNIVTPGTFTTFFETHPIVCDDLAAFQEELNLIVDLAVTDNVVSTLVFALIMPAMMGGSVETSVEFANGLDEVCAGIGVTQEAKAAALLGLDPFTASGNAEGIRTYLKNIIAGLLPDLSSNAMQLIKNLADEENGAYIYSGLTKIFANLASVLTDVSSGLNGMLDLSSILPTIQNINSTWASFPTIGEGENTRLDIQGTIGALVPMLTQQLTGSISLKIQFEDREPHDPVAPEASGAPGLGFTYILDVLSNGLTFRTMDTTKLAEAETDADVVKTIYDYLYDNLIADPTNNALLTTVLDVLPMLGSLIGQDINIPQDIMDFLTAALKMDNDELANELILMLANEVGRHVMTLVPAKDPTCTEAGNTAYYVCEACGLAFADEAATQEIDPATTVIPATGHTPADALVSDANGHYEVCAVCGATLSSAAHVDEDGDGLCDVCGYAIPEVEEPTTQPDTDNGDNTGNTDNTGNGGNGGSSSEKPVTDVNIPQTGSVAGIAFGAVSLATAGALILLRARSKKHD